MMVNIDGENSNALDSNDVTYALWKDWLEEFAPLTPQQKMYFDAEIVRAFPGISPEAKLNVLEIGFGQGSFLQYAKQRNWNVTGIEQSKLLVDLAKKNGFLASEDVSLKSLDRESFDLIVAFDVLEHIPNENIILYLLELKKLLKKDGVFIARFPNGDSPLGQIHQNGDITHVSFIGSGKIKFYSKVTEMELLYILPEARVLYHKRKFIKFYFLIFIKKVISLMINWIYTPKMNIIYHSANIVMGLRKN